MDINTNSMDVGSLFVPTSYGDIITLKNLVRPIQEFAGIYNSAYLDAMDVEVLYDCMPFSEDDEVYIDFLSIQQPTIEYFTKEDGHVFYTLDEDDVPNPILVFVSAYKAIAHWVKEQRLSGYDMGRKDVFMERLNAEQFCLFAYKGICFYTVGGTEVEWYDWPFCTEYTNEEIFDIATRNRLV